jgi:hypothetical protein
MEKLHVANVIRCETFVIKVPDDRCDELKLVAQFYVTFKWCVWLRISFAFQYILEGWTRMKNKKKL